MKSSMKFFSREFIQSLCMLTIFLDLSGNVCLVSNGVLLCLGMFAVKFHGVIIALMDCHVGFTICFQS